ncbi:glycosyltransferase [Polynucleobacter sp. AP-RePozz3-80-G7]|uniref:glycosyltransferase family 2 protein n=1 Tax=Polynucleobacter sp. AP-RePozz3-80-G7 TaxID=2689105 RepID=UPI001C0D6768|nr:glycosyltransferase [Polynucleobacter sp. AP-RePozz3-80-G7]MBU3638548.1 glycosyltransferase [Polynucleobacter sp. AP-RePozz3-80-G7]
MKSIPSDCEIFPLISVILPVYNGEQYLTAAVDSILNQTLANFELIIIDDGSTDQSLELLNQYKAIDPRIVLISRPNKNLVATLNESIEIARGKWIARMDQDDIAMPNRFEEQVKWLENTKSDICGSWVKFFGVAIGSGYVWQTYESDEAIKMDMLFRSPLVHPSVMMRSNTLKKLGYDSNCEKAEDYDLWVRATQAGYKLTNVPKVLLKYRRHEAQITSKSSFAQLAIDWKIKEKYWAYISKVKQLDEISVGQALDFIKSSPNVDLEAANLAFISLFEQSCGLACHALINNLARLYLKNAGEYRNVGKYWSELSSKFEIKHDYSMRLKLWIVGLMQLKQGGKWHQCIKKFYNRFYK